MSANLAAGPAAVGWTVWGRALWPGAEVIEGSVQEWLAGLPYWAAGCISTRAILAPGRVAKLPKEKG
ncbi:hypothetical protein NicSoilB11_06360 [Arthrobacter sp. NicSoilB11]|nr:hypothetical protein NicSoilB11_06360 [Arthrobacter sp. NicSoilB11]